MLVVPNLSQERIISIYKVCHPKKYTQTSIYGQQDPI